MKYLILILCLSSPAFAEECMLTVTQLDGKKLTLKAKDVTFSIDMDYDSIQSVRYKKDGKEIETRIQETATDILRQSSKCKKDKEPAKKP